MKSKGTLKQSRGAVAPLVAVMLILIVVCVALVVDLGHIHNVKVELQRAVDAAALAGAGQLPDEANAVSVAIAAAAANTVDNGSLIITADDVDLGWWNKDTLGQAAIDRFSVPPPSGKTVNAAKVSATRNVDHVFFFFVSGTDVTADAIAVREVLNPVVPFVVISCLPTGTGTGCAQPSFGKTVCDVKLYKFTNEPSDTAGWTPLIWDNLGANTMRDFIKPGGNKLFNEVIYGEDPDDKQGGLEYTAIEGMQGPVPLLPDYSNPQSLDYETGAPACGRANLTKHPDTSVDCGLGGELSDSATENDPLNYADNALPRWYQSQFRDILTMRPTGAANGYLCPNQNQDVLRELYNAAISGNPASFDNSSLTDILPADLKPVPNEFRDGRFARFIELQNDGTYLVNHREVLRYTGYPGILGNTGQITALVNDFLDRDDVVDANNHFKSQKNEPFTAGFTPSSYGEGETFRLIVPVVYAGSCEDFSHLGTQNKTQLYYVGTANIMLTRTFSTGKFACVSSLPPVEYLSGATCTASSFNPPLVNNKFDCDPGKTKVGFEGIIRRPGGLEEEGPQVKIYLVE